MPILSGLIDRLRGGRVAEMIGRYVVGTAQTVLYKSRAWVKNIDETIPDYEFWDKLRRGKASGYSLGGLFARRIEHVFASWILGNGAEVTLEDGGDPDNPDDPRNYTDAELSRFFGVNHALLMTVARDHFGLGDQYVIVNPDGTLSVPSPDTVMVERDELDYREVLAVIIETRTGKFTITDRFEPDRRIITIKEGQRIRAQDHFENLIGRIPIVHIAHDRSANETYGRSIHDELRRLYDQYDDVVYKQLDGAKLMGNPIPYLSGLKDTAAVIADNRPATYDTYTDKDGATETRTQITLDQNTAVLLGEGGQLGFASPPVGFTEDTKTALKTLFLLLLDHTGIPEFMWGNEMSSARASSDTQLTQWVRDIEARQRDAEGWLIELCDIWLTTQALVDPRIVVDSLTVSWPTMIEEDGTLQLERIRFAMDESLLTAETALSLLNLVDDPQREAEKAQAEAKERRDEMFPEGDTLAFRGDLAQAEREAA